MANVLIPVGDIHTGFWMNWSQSNILGYTLTLGPTQTMLLTSTMAAVITLCGIHLWTIVRYLLYQQASAVREEAPTPHISRQQLILRNTDSALTTARLMLGLACFNRNSRGRISSRALIIGILAFFFASSFVAFAILSTQMIVVGKNGYSPVLLRNKNCGVWNQTYEDIVLGFQTTSEDEFDLLVEGQAKLANDVQFSFEYAQECYSSDAATTDVSTNCQIMKKPAITNSSWQSTTCPFQSNICYEPADTIAFDTGFLDSHVDFGINAKAQNRLTYKRVTTCAVLNNVPDPNSWNGTVMYTSESQPTPQEAHAFFGPSLNQRTPWTYALSNFASFYNNFSVRVTNPYQVDVERAMARTDPQWTSSSFKPITGLIQGEADLNLIFLSFAGTYIEPVDDPWFSAHTSLHFESGAPFIRTRYAHDKAISTVGCVEKHQFCIANGTCTGMLGFDQVQNVDFFNNILNPQQNATFDRMLRAVSNSLLFGIISVLSKTTTPLKASTLAANGRSSNIASIQLPIDQWKYELQNWHSISMAQLQRTIVEWATGQIAPDPRWLLPPEEEQDRWFCENLVVISASYTSLRVLPIVVTIFIGLVIVISSIFVEDLVASARKWFRRPMQHSRWSRDDMLEMQPVRTTSSKKGLTIVSAPHRIDVITIRNTPSKLCNTLGFRKSMSPLSRASSQALSSSELQIEHYHAQRMNPRLTSGKHFVIHAEPKSSIISQPMRNSRMNISLSDLQLTPEELPNPQQDWDSKPVWLNPVPPAYFLRDLNPADVGSERRRSGPKTARWI